jgi:hypothetical protein
LKTINQPPRGLGVDLRKWAQGQSFLCRLKPWRTSSSINNNQHWNLTTRTMPGHACKAVCSEAENTEQAIISLVYWTVPHLLGACNVPCSGCGALHWRAKATLDQCDDKVVDFSTCCGKGKVTIPDAEKDTLAFPPLLMELFRGKSQSKSPAFCIFAQC